MNLLTMCAVEKERKGRIVSLLVVFGFEELAIGYTPQLVLVVSVIRRKLVEALSFTFNFLTSG